MQWHQLDDTQTICTSLQTDNHINTPPLFLSPNQQHQSTEDRADIYRMAQNKHGHPALPQNTLKTPWRNWVEVLQICSCLLTHYHYVPSVLWHCWLGGRKGIRPVENWVVGCWHGYQSGARCIWPSWCHCHSVSLASVKSRLVLPFWYRLTWVVPDKGPLNGCSSSSSTYSLLSAYR